MKVILNSGFNNPIINSLPNVSQIDQKELEFNNKKKLNESLRILSEQYSRFQKTVAKINMTAETKITLPIFNKAEYLKTGKLSRELYYLFEYGDPLKGIEPRKIMTYIKNL